MSKSNRCYQEHRYYKKQIVKHQDKIANPSKAISHCEELDIRHREALVNKTWPEEIKKFEEERDILQSILEERTLSKL